MKEAKENASVHCYSVPHVSNQVPELRQVHDDILSSSVLLQFLHKAALPTCFVVLPLSMPLRIVRSRAHFFASASSVRVRPLPKLSYSIQSSRLLSSQTSSINSLKSSLTSPYRHDEQYLRLSNNFHRSVIAQQPCQKRWDSNKVESSQHPLSGLWKPTHLQRLYYGSGSAQKHLLSCLPSESSKAFIITGTSLANKTPLIKQVEELLGSKHHAATYSKIGQHAPVKQLDEATEVVMKDDSVDTIISIGGGSPIDSAKAISYRLHEKSGKYLYHITIPTTLSAAECTIAAGYTNEDGMKTGVAGPELAAHVIIYDSEFMLETPPWLLMSTAMRSMDHAVELMCK